MAITDPNTEIWRPVIGYETIYEVSSIGRIKRVGLGRGARWCVLRTRLDGSGYSRAALHSAGKRRDVSVHRLVAAAFIGPCPPGLEVNHKNGIKTDNRPLNLCYVTHSENMRHAFDELTCYETCARGEQNGHATLTCEMIVEGRALVAGGATQQAVADKLGVRQTTVSRFVNRTTWKHVE